VEELLETAHSLLKMKERVLDMMENICDETAIKELKKLNVSINKLLSLALDNIKLEL